MKKLISIILLITISSSIFLPKNVFAYDDTNKTALEDITIDYDTYLKDSEKGSSVIGGNGEEKPYKLEEGTKNSIIKVLTVISNLIPTYTRIFMTIATMDTSPIQGYGIFFSVQKVVFNKIGLFDINFFDNSNDNNTIQYNLKKQITKFYNVLRTVAIVASLLVLIYTGIRMAMSSLAMEKAKYKKMIINWFSGFLILMALPYIMIIIMNLNKVLLQLCESVMVSLCGDKIINIEDTILGSSTTSTAKGFSIIIPSILYWILTFYQLKFFWIYGKRLFNTSFLIIISPLVIIQDIFDKVADDRSQAFKTWISEFSINVLMQPLHALLYMIFMTIASNIVEEANSRNSIYCSFIKRRTNIKKYIRSKKYYNSTRYGK